MPELRDKRTSIQPCKNVSCTYTDTPTPTEVHMHTRCIRKWMHRCTCLGRGRRGFPGLASSSRPNPGSHGLGLCLQCLKLRKHSTLINRCKHQVFHRDRNSDKLLRDKKKARSCPGWCRPRAWGSLDFNSSSLRERVLCDGQIMNYQKCFNA